MIEGFLLPNRPGAVKQPIDAMRGRAFQTLQNIYERKRPTRVIPQGSHRKMNMVRHHSSEQLNSLFSQTMLKDRSAGMV